MVEMGSWHIRIDQWLPRDRGLTLFLVFTWSVLWLSVGAEPPFPNVENISHEGFRAALAFLAFAPILFLSIKLRLYRDLNRAEWGVFLYSIALLLSGMFSGIFEYGYYFPCLMITGLLCLKLALKIDPCYQRVLRLFCLVTFFILLSYFVLYGLMYLSYSFANNEVRGYYVGSSLASSQPFFGLGIPRPTGFARSVTVLMILTVVFTNIVRIKPFWRLSLNSLMVAFILYVSARGTLAAIGMLLFVFVCLLGKEFVYKTFFELIKTLAGGLALIFIFKTALTIGAGGTLLDTSASIDFARLKQIAYIMEKSGDEFKSVVTSGRWNIWSQLLIDGSNNYLIGLGSQADRFLLNTSASNIFIYGFVCGGFIGLSLIMYVAVHLTLTALEKLRESRNDLIGNINDLAFVALFVFLGARSLFETGPGIFGVDYLCFIFAVCFLTHKRSPPAQ